MVTVVTDEQLSEANILLKSCGEPLTRKGLLMPNALASLNDGSTALEVKNLTSNSFRKGFVGVMRRFWSLQKSIYCWGKVLLQYTTPLLQRAVNTG